MQGRTKEGQTLDEVKDLFLGEIAKLKSGDFDENMLQANINNFKKYQIQQLEYNSIRADMFVQSFVKSNRLGRRSDRTGTHVKTDQSRHCCLCQQVLHRQ